MSVNFTKEQKELLDRHHTAIVSVISPKGYPIMTPIYFVEFEGKIYFSTEIIRKKGEFLAKNNHIGFNITHSDGFPFITIIGRGNIRRKNEFSEYVKILTLLFNRFGDPSSNEQGIQRNLTNENRILIEIVPERVIYPQPRK